MTDPLQVPVSDTGFRWGLGVFETVGVRDGQFLFFEDHLEELRRAAHALGLLDPTEAVNDIVAPQGIEGLQRWFWTESGLHVLTEPCPLNNAPPADLRLSPLLVDPRSWVFQYKTLAYLPHRQAISETAGDECVLVNVHAHIANAAMANLFWYAGGEWRTPAAGCGCRKGVVRKWMLANLRVCEGEWPIEELGQAEAVILTNSRVGIREVSAWEGKQLRSGHPEVKELQAMYLACLERMVS